MALETVNRCIVCNSDDLVPVADCQDHFITNEYFQIIECNNCHFHFTSPRPEMIGLDRYYKSDDYISHSKTSTGITNRLFHLSRIYTLAYKKRLVKKHSPGNSILDYGCGTGEFIHSMEKSDYDCFGIEPNQTARSTANAICTFKVTDESGLQHIPDGSLHAISLWHVLEHIYPIEKRLKVFNEKLSPDGVLFAALPNMDSYDAKKYEQFWAAWDVPRHIYHFSPKTIARLMSNNGFELIKIKPMLLDAFYISMLSEKYKHGTSRNYHAFLNGFRSNCAAFFNDRNYSSLIYIFKKSK